MAPKAGKGQGGAATSSGPKKIVKPPTAAHWQSERLIQTYWVPQHAKRRESAEFRRNKKFLRDHCKLPCWVCLKRGSKQNPLEVHHIFEWALWNLLDRARVQALLEVLEFYEDGYVTSARKIRPLREALAQAKPRPLRSADDLRNLVVLCQEHHRSTFTGVHMISFPIWIALAAIKKGSPMTRAQIVRAAAVLRRLDEATAGIVGVG